MAFVRRETRTAGGGSPAQQRSALRGLPLAAVAGLSLLAAACGGGSSGAKVAQVGTTSSTKGSGSSSASGSGNPTAYSACMRSQRCAGARRCARSSPASCSVDLAALAARATPCTHGDAAGFGCNRRATAPVVQRIRRAIQLILGRSE
jgi:hypothetical protein